MGRQKEQAGAFRPGLFRKSWFYFNITIFFVLTKWPAVSV